MDIAYNGVYDFPKQRVPNSEKSKPEWYANCCDWIIAKAIGLRNKTEMYQRYEILQGRMPGEFYKKILKMLLMKNILVFLLKCVTMI